MKERNGKKYISGRFVNNKFVVFKNNLKKEAQEPDFYLCVYTINDEKKEFEQARNGEFW